MNGVEAPDLLSGFRIECADQTLGVCAVTVTQTFGHRRSDDHHVTGDSSGRVQTDFATFKIDLFILTDEDAFLEIDHAVFAECRHGLSGFRIQSHQAISDRHEHDALVAAAVGPVRYATT